MKRKTDVPKQKIRVHGEVRGVGGRFQTHLNIVRIVSIDQLCFSVYHSADLLLVIQLSPMFNLK